MISDDDMRIAQDIVDGKYEGEVMTVKVIPLPKSLRFDGDLIAMIDGMREIWEEEKGKMSRNDVIRECIRECARKEGLI